MSRPYIFRRNRLLPVIVLVLVLILPIPASQVPATTDGRNSGQGPNEEQPEPVWAVIDAIDALVDVPGGATRALRVNTTSLRLEPVDWESPVEALSGVKRQAVDRVPEWLKWDLAKQLDRMGGSGDRYARLIVDCPEALWVDELAFSVAHTPPEVLQQVADVTVLRHNVRYLYEQDGDLGYADLVERTGEDGAYTTVSYLNRTGARREQPRDIYYWYVAHARVFWENPALVSGKSFWRKAYYDEVEWEDSGTLASHLAGCADAYQAANASTVWMQMNMEFGYGTNPLQPVAVILSRYGSCGQYSITTASSLKVAMIPARVAIYPASDHQWCEVFLDGHWMHVDASNDVAGAANEKEPELVRRTNSVNFNDAGVFERGWKPYMSALSTFRSDDVIINSIDIRAPDPAISMRETGMEERWLGTVHNYTDTSTVHVQVVDRQGDPVEAAYVGVFRVGHDIYNPSQPDTPHFAYANYTNATGGCEFELGLQGYCSRCGKDHTYGVLILSRYHTSTGQLVEMPVKAEGREYAYTFTISGDAPRQQEASWDDLVETPWTPELRLDLRLGTWGSQRHRHGEYGAGLEMFTSGTTFDHVFPADMDLMVLDEDQLEVLMSGGRPVARMARMDVEGYNGTVPVRTDRAAYLVLSNTDTMSSAKVVNVTAQLVAECYPRMALSHPAAGTDHSTDWPLVVNGTLFDRVPIETVQVSLDGGLNWTDVTSETTIASGTFEVALDVSGVPSGEAALVVRATDAVGVWREVDALVFLDAEDPELEIVQPGQGSVLPAGRGVTITLLARDNRELVGLRVRMNGHPWVDLDPLSPLGDDGFVVTIPWVDEQGDAILEAEARDGVGRTNRSEVQLVFDALPPILELRSPEVGETVLVGPGDEVTLLGSVWDDHGIAILSYCVDGSDPIDVTWTIGAGGLFAIEVPVEGWTDGEHAITVELADMAGLTDEAKVTFDRDTTPPVLVLEPLRSEYEDWEQVRLSGRVEDSHAVEGVWISIDGWPEVQLTLDVTGALATTLPSGYTAIGGHTAELKACDVLGNQGTLLLEYIVVDVTRPTLTITSPGDQAAIARGARIRLEGLVDDNVGVVGIQLTVGGDAPLSIFEGYDPLMGTWEASVVTEGRELGTLQLLVMALDAAGNEAMEAIEVELVDRTVPVLELALDPLRPPRAVRGRDVTLQGTATDDVAVKGVEYRIDGLFWVPADGALAGSALLLAIPTRGLTSGQHTVEVRVTDLSGNAAVGSTPFVVKVPDEDSGVPLSYIVLGVAVAALILVLLTAFVVPRIPKDAGPTPEVPPPGEEAIGPPGEGSAEMDASQESGEPQRRDP